MFHERSLPRSEKLYVFLSSMFVSVLVLTNVIGTKLFALQLPLFLREQPLMLTTGILTYPFTFWFTDVVSEIWGKKRADLMVFFGFAASLLMLLVITMARATPPAEIWRIDAAYATFFHPDFYLRDAAGQVVAVAPAAAQAAFSFTFDAPGVLLFASMLAYLCAQLTDNYLFHFWRRLTQERHLWLRNNGSTMVSQLVDTIIVNGIFLTVYWKLPLEIIVEVTITVYLVKMLMAWLDTPFIYLGVFAVRRATQTESAGASG